MNKKVSTMGKTALGLTLVPGLLIGGVASGAAISSASPATSVSTVSTAAAAPAATATSGTTGTGSAAASASTAGSLAAEAPASQPAGEKKVPIGKIVRWIKDHASSIWKGLKKAVKKGWKAFKNYWNDLSRWVRWVILEIADSSLWELYQALRDWIL